jgi:hypothetical protein
VQMDSSVSISDPPYFIRENLVPFSTKLSVLLITNGMF